MTALSQKIDRRRGEELGVDKYLVKSQITLEDVVQTIAELLEAKSQSTQQAGSQVVKDLPAGSKAAGQVDKAVKNLKSKGSRPPAK